jgi:hypothetical protein
MTAIYFSISEAYQKLCEEVIKSLCKNCPHQHDKHNMNCAECCPINRAIKEWRRSNDR